MLRATRRGVVLQLSGFTDMGFGGEINGCH